MKRSIVVAAAIVAVFTALLCLRHTPESARDNASGRVGTPSVRTVAPTGGSPDIASSNAASRQPRLSAPSMEFRPPIFSALPGGLNGRPLKAIYDELAKRADDGDANAAQVLGTLVDECNKILYGLNLGRRGGSPDPTVQKIIEERERVAGEQCPGLGEPALASAGAWLLRASEGGNRDALLRLPYFAPKAIAQDAEARKAHWRKVLTEGLARLGESGDFDAMIKLGDFYLDEGGSESAKEAYRWFDLASRAPMPASRIEFATKKRDFAEQRMASAGKNGG